MRCEICQQSGPVRKPRALLDIYLCGECSFQLELHVEDWKLNQIALWTSASGTKRQRARKPVVSSMLLYLDNTAWLSLIRDISALELIRALQDGGSLEIVLSAENLRELIIKDSIGEDRRAKNLFAVIPFLGRYKRDGLFALDHSRLGLADLPTADVEIAFDSHISTKSKPEKAIADGVHIANAIAFEADLVSCDHQVRMSALGNVQNLRCLRQLIDDLGGSIVDLDDCSCPLIQH